MFDFAQHPGRWFVLATLAPLGVVAILLVLGFIRNLLGWRTPRRTGAYLALAGIVTATVCAWIGASACLNSPPSAEKFEWLRIGSARSVMPAMTLDVGYHIDKLTVLMFVMVGSIATLIFVFSLGYMKDELGEVDDHVHPKRRGRYERFFLYLSLFAFSMFNLLLADNLLQVFIGWELVGVSSFFLIGFYSEKHTASAAANKAFLINRVGDAGFLVGIAVAMSQFGTLNIAELNHACEHPHIPHGAWVLMGVGLLLGAMGKSAQVPLQTWLPDAMEGPTPVSALIHAATMVAAGVYLVGRCFPMLAPEVLLTLAIVGLVTAVLSAAVAVVMTDIKRVLAFSTCSQLGYMMMSIGLGGWTAGLLHLLTHAFFKALLFLCAGSVIHGMHHEQDLRRMGGLRRKMPVTAFTMLVGVLAISGTPFFSGWYSKDQLLSHAFGVSLAQPAMGVFFFVPLVIAGVTAFYMFRLWFLAFGGTGRSDAADHAQESPLVMTFPLLILAVCSVGVAWGWPLWNADASWLGQQLEAMHMHGHIEGAERIHELAHANHLIAGVCALFVAVAGFGVAWWKYGKQAPVAAQLVEPKGVLANRWYFDAVYDRLFVTGTRKLSEAAAKTDRNDTQQRRLTLDGVMNSLAVVSSFVGSKFRKMQSGRVRSYVLLLFAVCATVAMVFALRMQK
jgi:NADH-quinone oxidoreductase subunit L